MANYTDRYLENLGRYKVTFYQGMPSTLKPNYGEQFSGYRAEAGLLATTTNPQTANILREVDEKLRTGAKAIEVNILKTDLLDAVPKQYMEETNRLAKLTGAELTVHGPLVEPSGIDMRRGYNEEERKMIENQIVHTLERVQPLNPAGNTIVTFHTAVGLPAAEIVKEKGKDVLKSMVIVDQESGRAVDLAKEEVRYVPGAPELKEKIDVNEHLRILNDNKWHEDLVQLLFYKDRADTILEENLPLIQQFLADLKSGKIRPETLTPTQQAVFGRITNAEENLRETHRALNGLFNKAYKFGSENDKKELTNLSDDFRKNLQGTELDPWKKSHALQKLIYNLREFKPELYKPLEKFAIDKAAETFGNAAFEAYKKFGEKTPIVSIENPPAGTAFSRAEDVKMLIEKSRDVFIKNAVENRGMSNDEAKRAAEKIIGATWDVGHINMIRKYGFDEVDVVKETEKIAPYVKHVHLSDNFGMEHTELPMGMGNVPLQKMMEKLGKTGEKVKKVIEVGSWFSALGMQQVPFRESLVGLGSPIYPMKSPYWNQVSGLYQDYFSGMGTFLPQVHYETFGAGFAQLPTELGGSRSAAGRSRLGGTPME
jgi:hypothetical protein